MYKYLAVILVVFGLFGCGDPSLQDVSYNLNSKPALWKVEKNHKTLYLFGSIHKVPKELKWYSPKIQNAYNKSNVLVVESLIEQDKDQMAILQKKYGFLPNGKVIDQFLTKQEYEKYQKIVKALQVDTFYADRLRPWVFFSILQNKLALEQLKYGVDILFIKQAKKEHKKVFALESSKEALNAIASIPLQEDIKTLKKFLQSKTLSKQELKEKIELFVSWANGDTDRMAYLISKNFSKQSYRHLVIKRNRLWYQRMIKHFKQHQTTIVVVGAAHLCGKDSLIAMLKKDGYKVTRVQ